MKREIIDSFYKIEFYETSTKKDGKQVHWKTQIIDKRVRKFTNRQISRHSHHMSSEDTKHEVLLRILEALEALEKRYTGYIDRLYNFIKYNEGIESETYGLLFATTCNLMVYKFNKRQVLSYATSYEEIINIVDNYSESINNESKEARWLRENIQYILTPTQIEFLELSELQRKDMYSRQNIFGRMQRIKEKIEAEIKNNNIIEV